MSNARQTPIRRILRSGISVMVTPELASHTETIPAAASASTDTARTIILAPNLGGGGEEALLLERISAQGIIPTDIEITVESDDWDAVTVPLPPTLIADVEALGTNATGVRITVRNKRQAAVPITLWYRGRARISTVTLDGAAISTPLPDVGGRPPYYDRNPAGVSEFYNGVGIAPHAETQRVTYTVPTGKKALLESMFVSVAQETAATDDLEALLYVALGSSPWVTALTFNRALDTRDNMAIGPAGFLPPGGLIRAFSKDLKTGGTMSHRCGIRITTFDY